MARELSTAGLEHHVRQGGVGLTRRSGGAVARLGDAASEAGEALLAGRAGQHAAALLAGGARSAAHEGAAAYSRWALPPHARGAVLYAGVVASGLNYVLLV